MGNSELEWTPSSQPGNLIYRAYRLFVRVGEPRLAEVGFSIGQFPVLAALRINGKLPQKDLAAAAKTEQPTMALTLSRMERDGLVQREPNPVDKRSSLFSLTPEATEKAPQVMEVLLQGNRDALAGFSDEEKATLVSLLNRVITNLETTLKNRDEG